MRTIIPFVLLVIISSCSPVVQELNMDQRKQITNEIKQMLNAYQQDVNNNGLLAEFKYLDTSADFYWVPPGYATTIPFDSVANILRTNAPHLTTINNQWERLKITPHSAWLANYTGILHSTTTDKQGKTTDVRLIETGTMIKRDEGWRLLCGQTAMVN